MNRLFAAVCLLVMLVCIGCDSGPPLGSVSGKVTMDGQPMENVLVTFVPEQGGRAATGKTDASGQYELIYLTHKGALVGKHKVTVTTLQEAKKPVSEMRSDSPEYQKYLKESQDDYNKAVVREPIPERYNAKTELVKEVSSGKNVIDLELTK